MAFIALFFITLSTVTVWRRRGQLPHPSDHQLLDSSGITHSSSSSSDLSSSSSYPQQQHQPTNSNTDFFNNINNTNVNDGSVSVSNPSSNDSFSQTTSNTDFNVTQFETIHSESQSENTTQVDGDVSQPNEKVTAGADKETKVDEKAENLEEPNVEFEANIPERLEWYTRTDFKDGLRPICRITQPFVLSNGTILLPDWMERQRRILRRCNIGNYGFYTPEVPPTAILKETNSFDVDFVLTIHLEKFQEPTHDPSVYLTEHILKPAYLFEVFGGTVNPLHGTNERRCYALVNGSDCSSVRPPRTGLKPGIFVPFKLEHTENTSWPHQMLNMMGKAYSHGDHELVHLNTSTIVVASHAGKVEGLIGTRFRSIMSMDGMFRHVPESGLKTSRLYSKVNGIKKEDRIFEASKCSLSIGIANSEHMEVISGAPELQEKLNLMAKFALPSATIDVSLIDVSPSAADMDEVKKQMQRIDVFLGGSGSDLNHIGFMHPSSTVYELMPFGIKPVIHKSLAQIMGLAYESVSGKPHDDVFKTCIDTEVYNLKKQGKVDDTPEWHDPLLKAWDAAVAEFMMSGSTEFDLMTADRSLRNYHSRICALKQPIEVGLDDTARRVLHTIKSKCGMQ